MSQKISFLTNQSFLNTSLKIVAYLMHHLACYNWSKNFKQNLQHFGELWPKNHQKVA